jgi:hypothetical protein
MRKLKSKVEICKLPSMTPVFLPGYREAHKLLPSPRWSPSPGIPCKGQALSQITPWIASGLPHAQVGLRRAFSQASPGCSLHLHYQASSRNAAGLVPSGAQWRPHHKRDWCDLARLQAPPIYNNGAHKHRVVRGMQTSLNTRPKPRAST